MKRWKEVKKTRSEHHCFGCRKRIKKGGRALTIIADRKILLKGDIIYFHNVNCYNEYEARIMEEPCVQ